ncbi:917_t:CDS:2, partial [Gigaspora rosea]
QNIRAAISTTKITYPGVLVVKLGKSYRTMCYNILCLSLVQVWFSLVWVQVQSKRQH